MAKKNKYSEGQIVDMFKLNRIVEYQTPRMKDWLNVDMPEFNIPEQYIFDNALNKAIKNIGGWNEEDLKMKFISDILPLGHLEDNGRFMTYFEKSLTGVVDGISLSVKCDFMVAAGVLDYPKNPYFHFQEYKPSKNPSGDSMAQLLEAMLLAQVKNKNDKPIYGCEVVGKNWNFVVMEGKNYCISSSYDSVNRDELLKIIGILRKFRVILETELL
jgi:hypothetical protein